MGLKYSKQREIILQALIDDPMHPTADDIYRVVRLKEPKISLGTVYRNLNQLAEMGYIIKIPMSGGSDRFDAKMYPHMHLVCSSCGDVMDMKCDFTEPLCKSVEEKSGYSIKPNDIVLSGLCCECKKAID